MASNTPGDIITLPQGGGALQGIGEKFSPDLFTGSGNFTVPLTLPPGRNGFKPQLSLSYSTGNGNGPFGLGWALSVPGVAERADRGNRGCSSVSFYCMKHNNELCVNTFLHFSVLRNWGRARPRADHYSSAAVIIDRIGSGIRFLRGRPRRNGHERSGNREAGVTVLVFVPPIALLTGVDKITAQQGQQTCHPMLCHLAPLKL